MQSERVYSDDKDHLIVKDVEEAISVVIQKDDRSEILFRLNLLLKDVLLAICLDVLL